MSGDVLKEYLVALGFKIDEASYKKFNEGLARSGRGAAELGTIVAGTAAAIELAVKKVADQYENLYYVAQRTGASVASLQAFEYGARQIGISADQSRGSIEGMGAALRTSPGLRGLLNVGFGIATEGRDAKKVLDDLIGRLKTMAALSPAHYTVAAKYAEMFGISEPVFNALIKGDAERKRQEAEFLRAMKAAGIDPEKAAERFKGFGRTVRELERDFDIFTQRLGINWVNSSEKGLKAIGAIIQSITRADEVTDGWATTTSTVVVSALALLAGRMVLLPALFGSATAAATGLWVILSRFIAPIAAVAALMDLMKDTKLTGELSHDIPALAGTAGRKLEDNKTTIRKILAPILEAMGVTGLNKETGEFEGETPKPKPSGEVPTDRKKVGAFITGYFEAQGWTRAQAAGITANLERESKFDPKAIGDGGAAIGLAQWHPDRQAAFKEFAGKDVREATIQEQLAFIQHELTAGGEKRAGHLLRGARTPEEAGGIVSQNYERPRDTFGEMALRGDLARKWFDTPLAPSGAPAGGATVVISQKTENTFHGVKDERAAADMFGREQARVNGDLVRNTAGAVQ